MDYQVSAVKDKYSGNENIAHGYKMFEDDRRYYSVWMQDGEPDPRTWATLLNGSGERDMPIFTREFCDYQGIKRNHYDAITIIN